MATPDEANPAAGITISHEDHDRRGGFVADRDGLTLGEMDYSRPQADLIIIEYTGRRHPGPPRAPVAECGA